jgi:cardiolipin synthase A/B
VYDPQFAKEVTEVFEQDLQHTKQITFDMWRNRPWHEKALENLSAMLSSQL